MRIVVSLTDAEYERLESLALAERRHLRQQAAYLIVRALRASADEPDIPPTAEQRDSKGGQHVER